MYIPLSQDDMSDYIDYINSTLRELNIGEKVSPVHQQVRLVLQIQIKLYRNLKLNIYLMWGWYKDKVQNFLLRSLSNFEKVSPVKDQSCFVHNQKLKRGFLWHSRIIIKHWSPFSVCQGELIGCKNDQKMTINENCRSFDFFGNIYFGNRFNDMSMA